MYRNLVKLGAKKKKKLYHGSPYKLRTLRPMSAYEKSGHEAGNRKAVYLSDDPEMAALYALARPRKVKRRSWATLGKEVHYVKGIPLNRHGYVYETLTDKYTAPPKGLEPMGYTVQEPIRTLKRKRVSLRGREHRFIPYTTKEEYKKAVKKYLKSVNVDPKVM